MVGGYRSWVDLLMSSFLNILLGGAALLEEVCHVGVPLEGESSSLALSFILYFLAAMRRVGFLHFPFLPL